jgi:mannan endo-1,4-beta-mannosidase
MSPSERAAGSAGFLAAFMLLVACSGPSLEVLDVAPVTSELPEPSLFLQADGDQLVWAGAPFRFLSLNAFTLTGCGNADELFDAAQLDDFFAALRPHSLVRTYAFEAQRPEDIDAVVQAAARHDQLLNLVLTDANGSCGDDGVRKDDAWFAGGFRNTYLPWVKQIVTRERAETSVGMWELVSSPSNVHVETLRAFYDEVGAVVHRMAPRQLVSSGTHGVWAYGSADNYRFIHDSPGVDVAGFRDYEQEPGAPPNLQAALDALAGIKPLILAEAGVFASPSGDATKMLEGRVCVSWAERNTVLQSWVEAAFQTRLAGIDVWNYLPVRRESCEYSTHRSDPLFALVHDAPLP